MKEGDTYTTDGKTYYAVSENKTGTQCEGCVFCTGPGCSSTPPCVGIIFLTESNYIIHRLKNS